MYCPSCGKQNPDGSKFCESCGSNMSSQQNGSPPSQQSSYSPPPPSQQQSYSPPPSQQSSYSPPQQQQSYNTPPQQNYSPPTYSQPGQSSYGSQGLDAPLTMGNYIVMMLLSSITCGIALLVWAFGSNVNTNKKNYSRAVLLMSLIAIGLSILFSVVFAGVLGTMFSSGSGW